MIASVTAFSAAIVCFISSLIYRQITVYNNYHNNNNIIIITIITIKITIMYKTDVGK